MNRFICILSIFFLILSIGCVKNPELNTNLKKTTQIKNSVNRGRQYFNQGRYILAESAFLQAIKKDAACYDAMVGLGLLYLTQKKFDQGEKYFKKALRIEPEYYNIYNYLGILYSEKGDYIEAKKMFLRIINAPKYRTPEMAYLNLAQLEVKRGNLKSALRYVNSGIKYNEKYPPLYFIKGLIYQKSQDYEKAVLFFKKADEISKKPDLDCLINLAEAYYKIGEFEKALVTLDIAFGMANSPDTIKKITDLQKKINRQN